MSELKMERRQNKTNINASVSIGLKKQIDKWGNSLDYGSSSNFVESGLQFYLGALYKENEMMVEALENELQRTKDDHEKELKTLEMKLKQSENEMKKYKDIVFDLMMSHKELAAEIKEALDQDERKNSTDRVYI